MTPMEADMSHRIRNDFEAAIPKPGITGLFSPMEADMTTRSDTEASGLGDVEAAWDRYDMFRLAGSPGGNATRDERRAAIEAAIRDAAYIEGVKAAWDHHLDPAIQESRAGEGLDVERLARADHTKVPDRCPDFGAIDHEWQDHMAAARAIAREYAALASPEPKP